MAGLIDKSLLITAPVSFRVGAVADKLTIREATIDTINGVDVSDGITTPDGVITMKNKSFEDTTTNFIAASDNTKKIGFRCGGTTGTQQLIQSSQTSTATATIPNVGNADFVMTAGAQTIGGIKTFSSSPIRLSATQTLYFGITATTSNATQATIFTLATSSNNAYMLQVNTVAASSGGSVAILTAVVRAKNVAGVLTVGNSFNNVSDFDAPLANCSVGFGTSGTSILITIVGIAATTINWSTNVQVSSTTF